MKIDIYIAVCENFVTPKTHIFNELTRSLNAFFADKKYGDDIETLKVGFILVLASPEYENWHKPKKLRYVDHKFTKSKLTGEMIEISKTLSFEIKLEESPMGLFLSEEDMISKKMLLEEINKYLSKIDKLPKKVNDFDIDRFLEDWNAFESKLAQ